MKFRKPPPAAKDIRLGQKRKRERPYLNDVISFFRKFYNNEKKIDDEKEKDALFIHRKKGLKQLIHIDVQNNHYLPIMNKSDDHQYYIYSS